MSLNPKAVRGTVARVSEGFFLNLADNISTFAISDARWPPYSGYIMIFAIIGLIPALALQTNLLVIGFSTLWILLCMISIPVITFLDLKNTAYSLNGSKLNIEKNFLSKDSKTVELKNYDGSYVSKGLLIPKILGIGSVIIMKNGKKQVYLEYLENPDDIESQVSEALK